MVSSRIVSTLKDLIPVLIFALFLGVRVHASTPELGSIAEEQSTFDTIKKHFGLTYFSTFNGPGLHPDTAYFSPNQLGKASNNGINIQNQFSIRWKISKQWAIDFQNRFYMIFNNGTGKSDFTHLRWETPRVGVSGVLFSGEEWSLIGAVNTDFPYFFPAPLSGYQAQQRKVFFNPGMFANLKYEPRNSRWSLFTVLSPRVFFYADRSAAEVELMDGGFIPGNKPELILSFMPTLNYRVKDSFRLTVGTNLDYRKCVVSNWNIFHASLINNGDDPAWRLMALPITFGITYDINPYITIFPYLTAYPIPEQRQDASTGTQASFWETASLGMWIRGTLF